MGKAIGHTMKFLTAVKASTQIIYLLILHMVISQNGFSQEVRTAAFRWRQLPSIPDSFGFAGCFAGVSNHALIVAGGANFPDGGAPWSGSKKVWSDKIFVLDQPDGQWKMVGTLPQPLGYGVSVTYKDRLICIGGSNAEGHYATAISIGYDGKSVSIADLPALPVALANCCGAVMGNVLYIAGGLFTPDATSTARVFWSLDLSKPGSKWVVLQTWPGPARMLSVAGVHQGSFYLFSGTDLQAKEGGQPQREYLRDAYQYTPNNGWKKLADLPNPVVAAPGPAFSQGRSLLIFGGDDGKLAPQASLLKESHPGFSDQIISFNTLTNRWSVVGRVATDKKDDADKNPNGSIWAAVTMPMVIWHHSLVFPNGEVRPAVRTPKVMMASPMLNRKNRK